MLACRIKQLDGLSRNPINFRGSPFQEVPTSALFEPLRDCYSHAGPVCCYTPAQFGSKIQKKVLGTQFAIIIYV